jgi:hypothetical protein
MSAYDDDAYEPGDPKRSDYSEPRVCVSCSGIGGHYPECMEVTC